MPSAFFLLNRVRIDLTKAALMGGRGKSSWVLEIRILKMRGQEREK